MVKIVLRDGRQIEYPDVQSVLWVQEGPDAGTVKLFDQYGQYSDDPIAKYAMGDILQLQGRDNHLLVT